MKKIILVGLTSICLLNASVICPNLSQKALDFDSKNLNNDLEKTNIVAWSVYRDSLEAYNKTTNIEEFFNKDSYSQYTMTPIWGQLTGLKTFIFDAKTNPDLKIKLEKSYESTLKIIDANNSFWCNKVVNMEKKQITNIIETTNVAVKKAIDGLSEKDK